MRLDVLVGEVNLSVVKAWNPLLTSACEFLLTVAPLLQLFMLNELDAAEAKSSARSSLSSCCVKGEGALRSGDAEFSSIAVNFLSGLQLEFVRIFALKALLGESTLF